MINIQTRETLGSKLDSEVAVQLKPFFDSIRTERLMRLYENNNFNSFHLLLLNDSVQYIFIGEEQSCYLLKN